VPTENNRYKLTGSRMPGVTMEVYQNGKEFVINVLEDKNGYFEGSALARPCA